MVVAVGLGGAILAAVLGLGLQLNLSRSAPRGVYRAVAGIPTRGAWVVACVSPEAATLARARGCLGRGSCAGGVQPILNPLRPSPGTWWSSDRKASPSTGSLFRGVRQLTWTPPAVCCRTRPAAGTWLVPVSSGS